MGFFDRKRLDFYGLLRVFREGEGVLLIEERRV
jgi:hypothetical protein